MVDQKLSEISLRGQEQHAQIAAVHDMAAEPSRLFNDPAELGVQLRRAAGDVHGRNIGLAQDSDTGFSGVARHTLLPVRARVHMAMPARLVAQLPDIDLKDGNAGGVERRQPSLKQTRLERRGRRCLGQNVTLLLCGDQRAVPSQ